MANQKFPRKPRRPKESKWVRTGGAVGDDSMDEMDKFIQEGCGVSEDVEDVGNMPNEKFLRKPSKNII